MKNKKKNSYQKYLKFTTFIQSKILPTLFCLLLVLILIALGVLPKDKLVDLIQIDVVFSVGLVTIITWIIALVNRVLIIYFEEKLKLNSSFEFNIKKYSKEKVFTVNGKSYPLVELMSKVSKVDADVCNEYKFKLDPIIVSFMPKLLDAHKTSKFKNKRLYRLDDITINGEEVYLSLSLSDMYATLITNRAMDYSLGNKLNIREIFEPGTRLNSLKNSKLNNGMGFNFIVKTSDNYYSLIKKTGKNASGKFIYNACASQLDTHFNVEDNSFHGLLRQLIYNALITNYNYPKPKDDPNIYQIVQDEDIKYLGVVRNLVEGGKPELGFVVSVNKTREELENQYNKASMKSQRERGNKKILFFKEEDYKISDECDVYFASLSREVKVSLISVYMLEKIKQHL